MTLILRFRNNNYANNTDGLRCYEFLHGIGAVVEDADEDDDEGSLNGGPVSSAMRLLFALTSSGPPGHC
jgi:hypothetical protein